MDLFDHQTISLNNAELEYWPQWLNNIEADELFAILLAETPWQQDYLNMAGKRIAVPRLQAWYGDPQANYQYSGLTLTPTPWTETLNKIKNKLNQLTNNNFNALLINLYRDQQDSVAWHADDEAELGINPLIASVSLGETRTFNMKPKKTGSGFKLALDNGSLLVMQGQTQHHWLHSIAKTKQPCGPRINLTFRKII